jgi:hypothetical protein
MTFQTPSEQQAQADQQSAAEPGGQRWSPVEALPAGWLPVCRTGSFSVPIRPSLSPGSDRHDDGEDYTKHTQRHSRQRLP